MAGLAAVFELDIKKVIALSTLRQLGIIFFSLGIRYPFLAFFHLISHAYFKAILFICAGAMIHSVKDYQDFRKIGGRLERTKFLASIILVVFCGGGGVLFFLLILFATLLTLFYSIRFRLYIFNVRSVRESFRAERDVSRVLLLGRVCLIVPSIRGGFFLGGVIPRPELIIIPI